MQRGIRRARRALSHVLTPGERFRSLCSSGPNLEREHHTPAAATLPELSRTREKFCPPPSREIWATALAFRLGQRARTPAVPQAARWSPIECRASHAASGATRRGTHRHARGIPAAKIHRDPCLAYFFLEDPKKFGMTTEFTKKTV